MTKDRGAGGLNRSNSIPISKVQSPNVPSSLTEANQHVSSFKSCSGQQSLTSYYFSQKKSCPLGASINKILGPRIVITKIS